MKFVYQPEGADPRKWEFAPEKLMSPEAEAIERATKMTYLEWQQAVFKGSMTALHALLWVMLKRSDPTLGYAAVEFSLSEVTFDMDDTEAEAALAAMEQRIAEGDELGPDELAALKELREQVAAAGSAEPVDGEAPKA